MVTLKINGKTRNITPISKLSFKQFNKIIVEGEVTDLKEYLSIYLDMDLVDLMNSEIKTDSMPALHQSIFDINYEEAIKNPPKTFTYLDQIHIVDELRLSTFGKNYFFDLYHGLHGQKKINTYQLCLYALAVAISKNNDMNEVEKVYQDLSLKNWRLVLPTAFFLLKRFVKKKRGSMILLIGFTMELKKITWLNTSSLRRLKRLEKNMLSTY